MKKTFLAMLLAGGTMTLFAQNTPGNQTEPVTNSPNTTQQSAGVPAGSETDKSQHVTNMANTTRLGENNMRDTTTPSTNINMRNGVRTSSTSWSPERQPSQTWNNYGVWNSDANWNANPNNPYANRNNNGVNGTTGINNQNMNNTTGNTDWNNQQNNASMNNQNNMNTDASMNSTGAYSAYGTTVPYLPANVQMRFNQDYPVTTNSTYSWHQYGDWFHTTQMNNGRSTQYFYNTRGDGYSLALPVLLTYVPENIVNSALNKYGNELYSISMVKTNDGNETYMIGLLDRGQVSMHYLNESGASVDNVWRTEDYGTMESTQSNAAMDGQQGNMYNQGNQHSNMNHNNTDMNRSQNSQSNWDAKKDDKKKHDDKKNHHQMR